jgi:N-acetylmuramoyl-L-alanine amidase
LSLTNRLNARIGSALSAIALGAITVVALFGATSACARAADSAITATYGTQTLRFTHVASSPAGLAIGVSDPAFADLLRATGAVLTWKPGERYVLITTSVPVVVSFAVGDRRFDVGPMALQAAFAPYQIGNEVYLPFDEVLRSLNLALRRDSTGTVLQPQLASLDVQTFGDRVALVAHAGAPLRPRVVTDTPVAITYEFDGVGTTLVGTRQVNGGGVRSIQITQSGTARDPKTMVTVSLLPGAQHDAPRSNDERDVVLGFSGSGAPPAPVAVATPVPAMQATYVPPDPNGPPGNQPQAVPAGPALVTGVMAQPSQDGTTVTIAVTGNATYEWHRLRDPDNRFWIDIAGAQLSGPPIDQTQPDPLISIRVRQIDPNTVRVAISLAGQKQLDVSPSATGLSIDVGRDEIADALREGTGSIGSTVSANDNAAPVTPAPLTGDQTGDSTWKFGPTGGSVYVPRNPRLIVIDPGHGGSDVGAARGGLTEAGLTLDMSKRLRDILVSRGWQVRMTRDTDVDVYQPDDTAHEELQARDDIANNAGARLLVSIHVNSFINSGPYGTTTYIAKPSDVALAKVLRQHLSSDLGTKDDGIIKSHLYIVLHALMPAALIETAFLSNPNDLSMLESSAWRQKVAQSIADGIDDYTREYPAATQGGQ